MLARLGYHTVAITSRCLEEDLGLPADADMGMAAARRPIVAAFVDRRSVEPEGGDRIAQLVGLITAPIFSLHSVRDRAATWFDREEDVVWLLAVGEDHDYDHFEHLARAERLLPEDSDYERFEAPEFAKRAFIDCLLADVARMKAEARSKPDQPVLGELAGRIQVRLCYELGEPAFLSVAIGQRLRPQGPDLSPIWMYEVANAFFPGVPFEDLIPNDWIDGTPVLELELALRDFWIDP